MTTTPRRSKAASLNKTTPAATAPGVVSVDHACRRPKPSTKLGIVLGLIEEPAGASLAQLAAVTGWLPHTTRAALTGLRKRGFRIELERAADAVGSVYRSHADAA